jgi:hypothetical protein
MDDYAEAHYLLGDRSPNPERGGAE